MTRKRLFLAALFVAAAIALYALLGFLALPYVAKSEIVTHVEQRLDHRLKLGEVRFNPFTGVAQVFDADLRDASGTRMLAWRHLLVDLSLRGLWHRTWTFDAVRIDAPYLHGELRADGTHIFSRLLEALRDPQADAQAAPPRIAIGRIEIEDGRLELADLAQGEKARLTLAPVRFALTDFHTERAGPAGYTLSARTDAGERIELSGEITAAPPTARGRLAVHGLQLATLARWRGRATGIDEAAGSLAVSAHFDMRAGANPVLVLRDLTLTGANLAFVSAGSSEPFTALKTLRLDGGAFDFAMRTVSIERLELAGFLLALARDADGKPNWPVRPPVATSETDRDAPQAASAEDWRIDIKRIVAADSTLRYEDARGDAPLQIAMADTRLELSMKAALSGTQSSIGLEDAKLSLSSVRAVSGRHNVEAREGTFAAGRITFLAQAEAWRSEVLGAMAHIGPSSLQNGDQAWRLESASWTAEALRATARADSAPSIEGVTNTADMTGLVGQFGAHARPLLTAGALSARAQSFGVQQDGAEPRIRMAGGGATLRKLLLHDPASGSELARIGEAELADGVIAENTRHLTIGRVTASDGHAAASVEVDGRTNWSDILAMVTPAPKEASGTPPPRAGTAWTVHVADIALRRFAGGYTDRRYDPPLAFGIADVQAQAKDLRTDRASPLRLDLQGRLARGGTFSATGSLRLQPLASDLSIKIADFPLLMAQPLLTPHVRLQVVSGLAAAQGRLRFGGAATDPRIAFEGDFGLQKVVLQETEPTQPLLALERLSATQTVFTFGPNRLDIPDMRVEKLATRLLIGEDQRVNWVKLLRNPAANKPAAKEAGGAHAAAVSSGKEAPPEDDGFPISVARISVRDSVLEFADLSLRPQFQARMHELHGVVTGLSSTGESRTRLELDARVDEFGAAKILGSLNPFRPERFTDVSLEFRNLEMTTLSPYAAKFAGYRIASGKLSLDLRYRVKNSALVGDNKIVVDKLELGERVESPSALDLPLELAIAILKDENGRIDIGLPVSGSLADPQFDIGSIVWKALGSLLGRIVTAPFRALAGLFGAGQGEQLDTIVFAPGSNRLAPPERQKLQTVAAALGKRPELKLTVEPVYAPRADRTALQTLAVRRAVLLRAGIRLDPGEAPGPLDYGNARIRQAIEGLYSERFGEASVRDLRAELAKSRRPATPPPTSADTTEQAPAIADTAQKTPTSGASDVAQAEAAAKREGASAVRTARVMVQRLTDAHVIDEPELNALAVARAERIAEELRRAAKVDPGRIGHEAPRAATDEGDDVPLKLQLGVMK